MLTLQTSVSDGHSHDHGGDTGEHQIRDIHALTPPRRRISRPASSLSRFSDAAPTENSTSISREFGARVLAGSSIVNNDTSSNNTDNYSTAATYNPLSQIGEEDLAGQTNPLAIVPESIPLGSGANQGRLELSAAQGEISLQRVKKEEVESKIGAWQNAQIAKINNRFKREEAVINGRESEQIQKANSRMKKVERKLEEKRARSVEKMQNDIAKARRQAEERKASAEGKRGTKVAKVVEFSNLLRAIGKPPPIKRYFF